MIKAVIFDVGGVILDMDSLQKPVLDLFMPDDPDIFWQDLNEMFSPLCRGEGNILNFWKALAKKYGKSIPEEKLKELWQKDFEKNLVINESVKEMIVSLKGKYKLVIISNIIEDHAKKLRGFDQFLNVYNLFDIVIFSNEVKLSKDSREIFIHALHKLDLKPEECLFTDDTKRFVDMAGSVGINAVQFKTAGQFRKDIKKYGVTI